MILWVKVLPSNNFHRLIGINPLYRINWQLSKKDPAQSHPITQTQRQNVRSCKPLNQGNTLVSDGAQDAPAFIRVWPIKKKKLGEKMS